MNNHLADNLISQINNVQIQKDKQLFISDADEVLLHFLPAFEDYLNEHGYWYDLKSYALFGNIKQLRDDLPIPNEEVIKCLEDFFKKNVRNISFVNDSIVYLKNLMIEHNFQIIILTNIPFEYLDDRRKCFADNDLSLPIIAGKGPKGEVIKEITKNYDKKFFFIDDLAPHIISTKNENKLVKTIHYISDPRLSRLADTPQEADFRAKSWKDIYSFITNEIN